MVNYSKTLSREGIFFNLKYFHFILNIKIYIYFQIFDGGKVDPPFDLPFQNEYLRTLIMKS